MFCWFDIIEVTGEDTIFKIMEFPSFRHCFITLATSWWEKETFGMNENCLILNILHVWPPGCYRNGQNIKKLFEPSDLAIELAARHCCLKSRVSKVYIRPNPLCQMPQLGVARVFDDGPAKGKGRGGGCQRPLWPFLSITHTTLWATCGHMVCRNPGMLWTQLEEDANRSLYAFIASSVCCGVKLAAEGFCLDKLTAPILLTGG